MTEAGERRTPSGLDEAYATAFVRLPIPLLVYDAETQRILAANGAACEQYGYTLHELLSMSIEELIDPADVPAHREVVSGDGPRLRLWRDRRKDGTMIWVEAASTEIPFEGRRARLVVAMDVTERERAMEALRASEARMRGLVGSIDEVLFEFDREGACLGIWTVNDALLVAPREEMLGRTVVELLGEERGRPLAEAIARVIDTGRAETIEYDVDLADGTHWALARIAPVPGPDGRPSSASFLARDITSRVRAEQELRRAEERWRTLVEQLPAVVLVERPSPDPREIHLEYVSRRAEEVYGEPIEAFLRDAHRFERTLHPEDRERVIAANARAEETGEPFDETYRVVRKDGRVIWVRSTSRLIRDAEGKPQEWVGVELDVTEQMEAAERLRLAEERYRTLVEQLPAVAFELVRGGSPSDMFFTYLSPQVEVIFGYPARELTGDPARFAELVYPEDRERVVAAVDRASTEETTFDETFRVLRPDGSVAWLHGRAAPVLDREGRAVSWQGIALDVTQQIEAAEALRQAEERYRLVVENAWDLIALMAPDGTILYASPSHRAVLGYAPDELVGRNALELVDPAGRAAAAGALAWWTGPEDEAGIHRVSLHHRDGRRVVVEGSPRPLRNERGEVVAILSIARDVTDLVRAEEERRELLARLVGAQEEERARIARGIHDDPLQAMVAVSMQLDLFAEECADPRALERLRRIQDGVRRTITRMRTLLFELAPPSLETGLAEAIRELAAHEDELGFELAVDDRTSGELPMEMRTAAFRIVQEALANVRKHARARRAWVRIEERDRGVRIAVEDDGVGIPPDRTRGAPGHYGLRSMRERASLAGGRLEVGPRPEGGTRVEVWLPAQA